MPCVVKRTGRERCLAPQLDIALDELARTGDVEGTASISIATDRKCRTGFNASGNLQIGALRRGGNSRGHACQYDWNSNSQFAPPKLYVATTVRSLLISLARSPGIWILKATGVCGKRA